MDRNYCINQDCKLEHCLWGKNGEKKLHLTDCKLLHCYGCHKHNVLELNDQGCVVSWYCENCRPHAVKTLKDYPKTVSEMQQRILAFKSRPHQSQLTLDETSKSRS